jgi:hypothetical protein
MTRRAKRVKFMVDAISREAGTAWRARSERLALVA